MDTTLLLKNVFKHIQLDDSEIETFVSFLQLKKIPKKDFLLKAGDICRTENFIVKGCVKTYFLDQQGREHIAMFGVEDWWVGDLYSFFTEKPSDYYIETIEDTEFIQISRENIEKLYAAVPKFERFFRLILKNAYIAQQNRITQNLSFTAEERYVNFLKRYPGLEQRISQKQIAAYLGITPVFMSMLKKKYLK